MTSFCRVFGPRIALGTALLASACQHDSNANFDDSNLTSPDAGGSGDTGGSNASAGDSSDAGSATAGSKADGGSASVAGKSSGGAGNPAGGKGGSASNGGKAGTDAGGAMSQAGKTGQGGAAGSAVGGGTGGSANPEPITVQTSDIDDTDVASCMQLMNFGEDKSLNVDGDGGCKYETLFDFPRLELPAGAQVSAATLTLTCTNVGGAITVAYANEAWKELMVRWNNRPEVGATLGTITCAQVGEVSIDLTVAFKAWLAGEHAADGIYLRTENTDGTDFDSSEADKASARPTLSVTYTLPVK
jgi:hypothetical protein